MSSQEHRRMAGAYIRQQRKLADLSMRQVSAMVGISNPYLSQIERGLRAPSEAVAAGIATALGVSVEDLYDQGEGGEGDETAGGLEAAIQAASELSAAQRASLTEIYRSFVRSNDGDAARDSATEGTDPGGATGPE